ncbi:MAG TPA: hypothetical protein DCS93_36955 [Microscillaceae bacterium]|nr:hypothetical protein [Microscillaceae bacterium]
MYRNYFPPCLVDGPIEPPVPYVHMGSSGAVPHKCSTCQYLFEGSCTRAGEELDRYLHLDHGSCKVSGPTNPVLYQDQFIKSKVEVPKKCTDCVLLKLDHIYGFYCSQDEDKWGDFKRGLDWGNWKPDEPYIELPYPDITTKTMLKAVIQNARTAFVKEYREVNPGHSFSVAIKAFEYLREKLKASQDNDA